jgi:hypothetical protein
MKPEKVVYFAILFIILEISTGCSVKNGSITGTHSTQPTSATLGTIDPHTETAFNAYPRAKEDALKWNEHAILYQIPSTRLMEKNLGLSGGGPAGWFFMFKVPGSPVELYVEIVNNKLYGRTEAQPVIIGEPKYKNNPIDLNKELLDSDKALDVYLNDGGKDYFSTHKNVDLDYRLVYLEGTNDPIWSIFDASDLATPLYDVDAVTGKKTQDPYSQVK